MTVYSQYKSEKARNRAFAVYDSLLSRWPVPYETRYVDTEFGSTHVVTSGPADAPPLVLLAGASANATSWILNIAALADPYRVYALDTIGDLGKSAGTRPKYASGDHTRWLNEVFERLDLAAARVGGRSLGGWMAFQFAMAFPNRVERLALLAPGFLQKMRTVFIVRGMFSMFFPRAVVIRSLSRYMTSARSPGWPDWMADAFVTAWKTKRPSMGGGFPAVIRDDELSGLEAPTLLLLGSDEVMYDAAAAAARVRSVAPRIQVEIIPDAGHVFAIEQPEATNRALLEFFG